MIKKFAEKLFGGMKMTWLNVILFAVATALITALFLIIPTFKNTSFEQMGVTFEAWVFFAIIIMANCKGPLESALKTFVFFLVSQPLIYLLQVPFSFMGWGLFGYYKYWFIITLLTLPAAFIGWYIKKKNWLSLVILSPMLLLLAFTSVSSFRFAFMHFPYRILTAVFCLFQVLIYMVAFTRNKLQKILGIAVPFIVACVFVFGINGGVSTSGSLFLPDDPVLTESAQVITEGEGIAQISISVTGEDSMVYIEGDEYGTMDFTIQDGDNEYPYTLTIYEDDQGYVQTRIEER